MKFITLFTVCLLACCIAVKAQPPRDSVRHDTTLFGWDQTRAQLINAPILRGNSEGTTIVPVRQQFCFDMTMEIELFYGGRRSMQTCLFINTVDGYMGYTQPSMGGAINVLMPEVESFRFTVVSFKLGNIFTYHNRKGNNNILQHLVSTSNTDTHEYQMNNLLTASPLSRKSEHRMYCDGKADALAYKRSDEPTTWFIYGDRYPATLQAQKFLGGFGVGVVRTDAGVYIVMERQSGTSYTVIKRIERTRVCFDPAGYKMEEADFFTKRTADLVREREKLDRDEAAAQSSGRCVPEKMAVINFRREQLQVQEDNLRKSQAGNLIQDRTAQKGMIDMMDPVVSVQTGILQAKVGICNAQEDMSRNPSHAAGAQQKIDCLNHQISVLMQAENDMRAAERRYAANPGQAFAEKSKIYMTAMRTAGCN
ncbi:hypothetical protein [Ferruginibacter profundus]